MFTHIDLFSGIGGFALAAQWAGFRTVAFCEIDPYAREVLKKNFPDIPICPDIKDFTYTWLFGKNDGKCETSNSRLRMREISSSQSKQTPKPKLFASARHAEGNGNSGQVKSNAEKEDSVRGNVVELECAEPGAQTLVVVDGCGERETQIGNMTRDTKQSDAITRTGFLGGGDESLRETIIAVNNANGSRENAVNSTPITSRRGLNFQRNDSTSQTELLYAKSAIDLLTAGPPCQPASQAGKHGGATDDRWLWPETFRVIREFHPRWCLLENVPGILTLDGGLEFEHLLTTLEEAGYSVWPLIIPACAVDAKHRRDRVWIIAHRSSEHRPFQSGGRIRSSGEKTVFFDRDGGKESLADAQRNHVEESQYINPKFRVGQGSRWPPEPYMGRVADDVSARLDRDQVNEQGDFTQEITEGLRHIRNALRQMWQHGEFTKTPPILRLRGVRATLSGMSYPYSLGSWHMGQRLQEDEELRSLWERVSTAPFKETQHLLPILLERIRQTQRDEKMGQEPNISRVAAGVKKRVDRLKGLGNAIVPQIAYEIIAGIRDLYNVQGERPPGKGWKKMAK